MCRLLANESILMRLNMSPVKKMIKAVVHRMAVAMFSFLEIMDLPRLPRSSRPGAPGEDKP